MEFDKSRVYTALNADELKAGDKVIGGNTLADLKYKVGIETIDTILDEGETYRFTTKEGEKWLMVLLVERKENCTNCEYSNLHKNLLYCEDDNIPIYVGGEKLSVCDKYKPKTEQKAEKKCKDCGNAIDEEGKYCSGDEKHHWVDQTGEQKCWRPKAEQKAETPELISLGNGQYAERKHCRPFKNTDELIKVWDAKIGTPKWGTDGDLTMPHIWVRRKEANSKGQLITEFGDELHVSMGKEGYNMFDLFLLFTFLDGSVCGVEE